jgi:hypothetical protein
VSWLQKAPLGEEERRKQKIGRQSRTVDLFNLPNVADASLPFHGDPSDAPHQGRPIVQALVRVQVGKCCVFVLDVGVFFCLLSYHLPGYSPRFVQQPGPFSISSGDLADFILSSLLDTKLYNSCPYVVSDSGF